MTSYFGGLVNSVVTIIDDFGFYDGDNIGGLTPGGVFGEDFAVFFDGVVGGGEDFVFVVETDFKSRAPFGESEAHLIVFLQSSGETVETFGVGFFGIGEFFEALINFDARDDAFTGEVFDDILTVIGGIAGGFIKEDNTIDVIFETVSSEKDITIIMTVVEGVVDFKLGEFFADGTS